jgi:hypothetical protein
MEEIGKEDEKLHFEHAQSKVTIKHPSVQVSFTFGFLGLRF